jgi:hypothetical protein
MQVPLPCRVNNVRIEASVRSSGYYRVQLALNQIRALKEADFMNVLRQAHPALHSHFPEPGGLEAKFNQPRRYEGRLLGGLMMNRQVPGHLPYDAIVLTPCPL